MNENIHSARGFVIALCLLAAGCVSAPPQQFEALRQGEALLRNGVAAFRDSDHAAAVSLFDKALVHYRSIDFRDGILEARINLAQVALAMGNVEGLRHQLNAVETMSAVDGPLPYAGEIRLLQASFAIRSGDLDAAEGLLSALLTPNEGTGNERIRQTALANRVHVALLRDNGTATQWLDRLRESLRAGSAPNPVLLARSLRFEAKLAARDGRAGDAEALLLEAYANYQAVPYRPGIAASLEELAQLDLERQQYAKAADRLLRALYVRTRMLHRERAVALMSTLRNAYLETGQAERAQRIAELEALLEEPRFDDWPRLNDAVQRL